MECTDPNCINCEGDVNTCTECDNGYTVVENACKSVCRLNEVYDKAESVCKCGVNAACGTINYCDGTACVSCRDADPTCKECDSADNCTLHDEKCVDVNCALCPSNPAACTTCSTDFTIVSYVCRMKCPNEQTTCEVDQICSGTSECSKCASGMLNIGNECKCGEATCTSSYYCDNAYNLCTECATSMPNCTKCSAADKCTTQKEKCDMLNCSECPNNKAYCVTCLKDFTIEGDKCLYTCGEAHCLDSQICTDLVCKACPYNQLNVAGVCKCGEQDCTTSYYCDGKYCESCSISMPNCQECTQPDVCITQKYECTALNCTKCPNSRGECVTCNYGFTIEGVKCLQTCGPNNCQETHYCAESGCKACRPKELNIGGTCSCNSLPSCAVGNYCNGYACELCATSMPNCAECEDQATCTKLAQACYDNNCEMCSHDLAVCTACAAGYRLQDAKCVKIACSVWNCQDCVEDVSVCQKCDEGYQLSENKCLQTCGEAHCLDSQICTDLVCESCSYKQLNVAGVCKCSGHTCAFNYYCDGKYCEACSTSMPNCIGCTYPDVCIALKDPCKVRNCDMCPNAPETCQKCIEGFDIYENICLQKCSDMVTCLEASICDEDLECEACPQGMLNHAGKCQCGEQVCDSTKFCPALATECVECDSYMPNCLKCTSLTQCAALKAECSDINCNMCQNDAKQCTACTTNFTYIENVCLYTCGETNCDANSVCTEGYCVKCWENEQNTDGVCSCGAGSRCQDGLFCDSKHVCVACSEGCVKCTPAGCTQCKSGYKLDKVSCVTTSNTGMIVAIVVAVVIVVAAAGGLWYYFAVVRRKSHMAVQIDKARSVYPKLTAVQTNQLFI